MFVRGSLRVFVLCLLVSLAFAATQNIAKRLDSRLKNVKQQMRAVPGTTSSYRNLLYIADDECNDEAVYNAQLDVADCIAAGVPPTCAVETDYVAYCEEYEACVHKVTEYFELLEEWECPITFFDMECTGENECAAGKTCYNGLCEAKCDVDDDYSCCTCMNHDNCDMDDYCMQGDDFTGDVCVSTAEDQSEPWINMAASINFMCIPTDKVEHSVCMDYMLDVNELVAKYEAGVSCDDLSESWNNETLSDCCMASMLQMMEACYGDEEIRDMVESYIEGCEIDVDLDALDYCDSYIECEEESTSGVSGLFPSSMGYLTLLALTMHVAMALLF